LAAECEGGKVVKKEKKIPLKKKKGRHLDWGRGKGCSKKGKSLSWSLQKERGGGENFSKKKWFKRKGGGYLRTRTKGKKKKKRKETN